MLLSKILCHADSPITMQRDGVTLQVNSRVQIFLVSGFMTPHCLLRSNSLPVGKEVPMNLRSIFLSVQGRIWSLPAKGPRNSRTRPKSLTLRSCYLLGINYLSPIPGPGTLIRLAAQSRAAHTKKQKQPQAPEMPGKPAMGCEEGENGQQPKVRIADLGTGPLRLAQTPGAAKPPGNKQGRR